MVTAPCPKRFWSWSVALQIGLCALFSELLSDNKLKRRTVTLAKVVVIILSLSCGTGLILSIPYLNITVGEYLQRSAGCVAFLNSSLS